VPAGVHDGLPFGLQIIGRAFAEDLVLRIAAVAEQAVPWTERRPAGLP
jgi:Asp-tRNA(Asn)/Glu-tRNA(Gln) amidotransferase A subunit family amidase